MQLNLARYELQFACWLTRRQCLTWLSALRSISCEASNPEKRIRAAGAKVPLDHAETPVQQLQNATFRVGKDRVSGVFKPVVGEAIRFSQGKPIADQVYHKLFSVAVRAGWDPEVALARMAQARARPAASHLLH